MLSQHFDGYFTMFVCNVERVVFNIIWKNTKIPTSEAIIHLTTMATATTTFFWNISGT